MDYVVSKILIDLYKNIEENQVFESYRDKMLDIIKKYMEKQNPTYTIAEQTTLKTSIITKTYYPKGIFKVYIEKNDIYATLEVLVTFIMTKNKGIFVLEENMPIIGAMIKIINKLVDEELFLVNDNVSNFDFILCIGTKRYYEEVLNFSYKDIIYLGYGESDAYFGETALNKREKVEDSSINIYSNISIAEAVTKMNELGSNFTSVIFTKDENEVKYFVENCMSKNVYVNMLPSKKCYLDLDLNLFVRIKNIIISK